MIQFNKVTWYSQAAALILGIIIFAVGFYTGSWQGGDKDSSLNESLKNASTTVSFRGLEMKTRELPPLPSEEEWQLVIENSGVFRERIEDDFKMYGDIAKRYYSSDMYKYLYIKVIEVELTSDDKPEKVVSFDGGGTYGITKYEIIKDDKIVAIIEPSSTGRSGAFLADPSENGFTMTWYRDNDMFPNGYCCPVGHMITRFVYEDNIFKPVYEQEVWSEKTVENPFTQAHVDLLNIHKPLLKKLSANDTDIGYGVPALASEAEKKFPDIAGYFFDKEWYVIDRIYADINHDGDDEQIVNFFGPYFNRPAHGGAVIDGNDVIASLHIDDIEDKNGYRLFENISFGVDGENNLLINWSLPRNAENESISGSSIFLFKDGRFLLKS